MFQKGKLKKEMGLGLALFLFLSTVSIAQGPQEVEGPDLETGLVEVEPPPVVPGGIVSSIFLIPYKYRRDQTGHMFSFGWGSFVPKNYLPNFVLANFQDVYPTDPKYFELSYQWKYHFSWISLGWDLGVGIYQVSSLNDYGGMSLSAHSVRWGTFALLDGIFLEPYVAPYVGVGAYTVFYEETLNGNSFKGRTQAAIYGYGGLQFQLNWLDPHTALEGFLENGIQNTFLYLEGKYFLPSWEVTDPDFSMVSWSVGLRIER